MYAYHINSVIQIYSAEYICNSIGSQFSTSSDHLLSHGSRANQIHSLKIAPKAIFVDLENFRLSSSLIPPHRGYLMGSSP